ncbi:MAG: hypothetical protein J6Q53_03135 [Oscillospiraceae bacterium]|nr:hypothetical protein [Oscillospiraceae bacterium]
MFARLDSSSRLLLLGICLFFGTFLFSTVYSKIKQFRETHRYIRQEIRRSSGAERRYWMQEKKQLWLSLLPFRHK